MMQVAALFRHPIKSHGRETLQRAALSEGQTMPWDRVWAVTHEATKFDKAAPAWTPCANFMLGTRTPGLAGIWATLDEAARRVTLRHEALGEITFHPDDKADVARFLAWVAPLCPADRAGPTDVVSAPGRGMTDSAFPSISIMNTASLAAVSEALGAPLELERWRGNIWLDGADPWAEWDWIGRDIRVGGAVLRVRERIKRCMHTAANPHSGERDADTLGTLNTVFGHQDFGVYAEVVAGGDVQLGDEMALA